MKYPFVIFYRKEEHKYIDDFFMINSDNLNCSVFIADNVEYVKNLFNSNFHLLVTYGDSFEEIFTIVSERMLKYRHIHLNTQDFSIDSFNELINNTYIQLCSLNRELTRPIFSLFTPSYNSFNKINRVYNSLKKQTFLDWEWIIIDDSPDDKNFQFLRDNFANDSRIRFFRRSTNNGSIGNVKNETIGLCRGKYVLEMDHDDELMPYVLEESAKIFDEKQDVGFIYYDCACVYENGNNQWYGDFICKGYGGYYSQKYDNKWLLVYITPNINNITMSHLVCCPNHPRIWRKDVLLKIGSYSEYLPICDDYEILLRTAISTNIVKVHKLGYIQYMNDSNNNFSLIRNAEINRIGPLYISPIYYNIFNINNVMKSKDAYEDEKYIQYHSKIWERDQNTYQHKYCNTIMNMDYDKQYCIIGLDSLIENYEFILKIYNNVKYDFIVLENKCNLQYLQDRLERMNFQRMKCYSLIGADENQLINYFKLLYLSTDNYEIINVNINKPKFNTDLSNRFQIINKLTNKENRYLEIGVEYGETFKNVHFLNKVGVDPDPKFIPDSGEIVKLTSDEYFNNIVSSPELKLELEEEVKTNNIPSFDSIFIDGMHQAEYVVRDLNNSQLILSTNGIIFIDDILPFNYNEQLKVPIKHYYENGILKYGENWTGDVWKVIYHILTNYKINIRSFKYYYNQHFRGIGVLQINSVFKITDDEINKINNYDYFKDFNSYVNVLKTFNEI